MAVPSGYTELGLIGFTHKGTYSDTATYNKYNCVVYDGSTYVALTDRLTGVTPSDDGTNWQFLARGFQKEDAKHVKVIDKDNYVGQGENAEVILQDWADKVADDLKTADSNISTNADAIAAETTRATGAEQTNADAIAAEATRATGAEQTNATNIASLQDAFDNLFEVVHTW